MNTLLKFVAPAFAIVALFCVTGCQSISSTARRAGVVGVGAAAGGAAGYAIGDKSPMQTALGAVVGGALGYVADRRDHTGEGLIAPVMIGAGAVAGAIPGALIGLLLPVHREPTS